jgi:hypothetical protein
MEHSVGRGTKKPPEKSQGAASGRTPDVLGVVKAPELM